MPHGFWWSLGRGGLAGGDPRAQASTPRGRRGPGGTDAVRDRHRVRLLGPARVFGDQLGVGNSPGERALVVAANRKLGAAVSVGGRGISSPASPAARPGEHRRDVSPAGAAATTGRGQPGGGGAAEEEAAKAKVATNVVRYLGTSLPTPSEAAARAARVGLVRRPSALTTGVREGVKHRLGSVSRFAQCPHSVGSMSGADRSDGAGQPGVNDRFLATERLARPCPALKLVGLRELDAVGERRTGQLRLDREAQRLLDELSAAFAGGDVDHPSDADGIDRSLRFGDNIVAHDGRSASRSARAPTPPSRCSNGSLRN